MTDSDSAIISDAYRSPITVQRKQDGIILRTSKAAILLSDAEIDRRIDFLGPRLGRLARFTMAPKTPLAAPESDDLTLPG